ncbi:MAG: hypothetical protein ACHQQQ_02735 [Bacteroidota bacterium]
MRDHSSSPKLLLYLVLISFCYFKLQAQTPIAPADTSSRSAWNNISVELLGNGFLYSLNYERMLTESFSLRGGFMTYSLDEGASNSGAHSSSLTMLPIMANFLLFGKDDKLEIGVGPAIISESNIDGMDHYSNAAIVLTGVIGIRHLPGDGGITYGAGWTPFFGAGYLTNWFGVNFGYAF